MANRHRDVHDRHTVRLWLRPSEFLLLVAALLFYFLRPTWPWLYFAHARVQAAVGAATGGWMESARNWVSSRGRIENMQQQMELLQKNLDITRAELRTQSLQILENDALRSLFLLPDRPLYHYVPAEVVSLSVRQAEARMFVKISWRDTAASPETLMGSPAIVSAHAAWSPVGRVVKVHPQPAGGPLAEIMLLTDPQSTVGVTSADSPELGGALLIGRGLDRLELNYSAQPLFLQALSPGMRLVTSPESQFPAGMDVAVLTDEGESFRPRPVVLFGDMRFVVILVRSPSS